MDYDAVILFVDLLNEVDVLSVSKWLLCVYKSLDEFGRNDEVFDTLRSLVMIPLANGSVTSIAKDTVFFPISSSFPDPRGMMFELLHLSKPIV